MLRQQRADLERKKDNLQEQADQLKAMEFLLTRVNKAEDALEQIRVERDELKAENKALVMKLAELQKMTTKVVEKTEHEDLLKVLRTYMNRSKSKTATKREYIKVVITEMALTAGLSLPEDMMETLESFDDEEEKKVENHFAKDSVHFGAGSTMNGNVITEEDNNERHNE